VVRKAKVLYVLHNHPSLHPGGPETYSLELYEAMRESAEFEPVLVARAGSERGIQRSHRPGAPFSSLDGDPNQYLVLVEQEGFDFFYMTYGDKSLYTRYFADFLRAQDPDLVHFQHSLFIGCELISLIHYLLPAAPIIYTLHDYAPICHRDGKLVRTGSEALCSMASPRRCHECFPEVSEQDFFLRSRFIRAHLDQVDLFLAPSRFLFERYVDWGIPREKIRLEDYGRRPALSVAENHEDRARNRLGFFGDLSPFEGTEVLLEAMRIVRAEEPDVHLWLYGSNLWKYSDDYRKQFWTLLHDAGNVTFGGGYDRGSLPQAMSKVDWVIVPSRWWESSPLAVAQAFQHGRPVICSDIGGMAETVAHGVNGLHFTVGDPRSLADTVRRAVTTPQLWEELRRGIPAVHSMDEHVANLTGIYRELLDRRSQIKTPELL
jgi:glycosyltransferase involved in cell wall biosynthesis